MQGNLARPVWGWGPGEIPGPTPLFAGHDAAGQVAADWYTLIASAERHGVDPQHYLTSVLAQLPTLAADDLPRLLPDAWQRDLTAEALSLSAS
jgi:hypothetical protein